MRFPQIDTYFSWVYRAFGMKKKKLKNMRIWITRSCFASSFFLKLTLELQCVVAIKTDRVVHECTWGERMNTISILLYLWNVCRMSISLFLSLSLLMLLWHWHCGQHFADRQKYAVFIWFSLVFSLNNTCRHSSNSPVARWCNALRVHYIFYKSIDHTPQMWVFTWLDILC